MKDAYGWKLFSEAKMARELARLVKMYEDTGKLGAWKSWCNFIDAFPVGSDEREHLTSVFCNELDSLDQVEHDPQMADIW